MKHVITSQAAVGHTCSRSVISVLTQICAAVVRQRTSVETHLLNFLFVIRLFEAQSQSRVRTIDCEWTHTHTHTHRVSECCNCEDNITAEEAAVVLTHFVSQ